VAVRLVESTTQIPPGEMTGERRLHVLNSRPQTTVHGREPAQKVTFGLILDLNVRGGLMIDATSKAPEAPSGGEGKAVCTGMCWGVATGWISVLVTLSPSRRRVTLVP